MGGEEKRHQMMQNLFGDQSKEEEEDKEKKVSLHEIERKSQERMAGVGQISQNGEPVVIQKKASNAAAKKDEKAVNAARRSGADMETVKKSNAGTNKAASSSTTLNTRKLDDETKNLSHDRLSSELKENIMQGRIAKKFTQAQLAQLINEKPQVIQEYKSGKAIPNQQKKANMNQRRSTQKSLWLQSVSIRMTEIVEFKAPSLLLLLCFSIVRETAFPSMAHVELPVPVVSSLEPVYSEGSLLEEAQIRWRYDRIRSLPSVSMTPARVRSSFELRISMTSIPCVLMNFLKDHKWGLDVMVHGTVPTGSGLWTIQFSSDYLLVIDCHNGCF